jgi:lipoprotein-anchoring transpeptidase ErfK/SrfK
MKIDPPTPRLRRGGAIRKIDIRAFFVLVIAMLVASCAAPDTQHRIVISTREQKLAVLDRGTITAVYPISTSKYGLGDWPRSFRTPLGEMEVAEKIGEGAQPGTVFKDRRSTGEIVGPDAPGRDPIVTRILWLRGHEPRNANAFGRHIYIHGTPEEHNLGLPVSYGCIRMRSSDVVDLFNIVGLGARVTIADAPLAAIIPGLSSGSQMAKTNTGTMVMR